MRSTAMRPAEPGQSATATVTVAINAQVNPANPGGAESAIQGLLRHLAAQAGPHERFLVLATSRYAPEMERWVGRGQEVLAWPFPQLAYAPFRTMTRRWQRAKGRAGPLGFGVDAAHRVWWQAQRRLERPLSAARVDGALRARGVEVVHFPYAVHFPTTLPFVYEPLDLQHRHLPEFFPEGERRWRESIYRSGCEHARLIVTGTRFTKYDIVREYGIDPRKIAHIPIRSAMPQAPTSDADVARVRRQYALPERFLLYPAMGFPHKNHLRLFEALALLRDRHDLTLPLVCTGRPYEPHQPVLDAALARLRLTEQVRMLGSIPTDDLAALFGAAWALVYPSLFEGIGMPVQEALQYGLPVISSNATCLPEVAGDAALYFEPTSVEAIAEAILAAHQRPNLLERRRREAPTALAQFDWPRAAKTYVACFRAAAGAALTPEQRDLYEQAVSA
jgi:glycosyltransferase involved in cell wall biosynthesis